MNYIKDSFTKEPQRILWIYGPKSTGKTTLIKTITNLLIKKNKKVLLAAPTGRAAKRLNEATGVEAKTIHRLLDYQQLLRQPNQKNLLP